jgi:hypothetical protein
MHATGTRSLETGPASQGAPKLHHHTADLVAHGGMALVVVNWRSTAVSTMYTVSTVGTSGSGGGGGCGSCGCTLSVCPAATHQTGPERWAGGSACSAGSAGSVAACERHGC